MYVYSINGYGYSLRLKDDSKQEIAGFELETTWYNKRGQPLDYGVVYAETRARTNSMYLTFLFKKVKKK